MEAIKELAPLLGLSTVFAAVISAAWSWISRDWAGTIEKAHAKYVAIDKLASSLETFNQGQTKELHAAATQMRVEALTALLKRAKPATGKMPSLSFAALIAGSALFFVGLGRTQANGAEIAASVFLITGSGLLLIIASIALLLVLESKNTRNARKVARQIIPNMMGDNA